MFWTKKGSYDKDGDDSNEDSEIKLDRKKIVKLPVKMLIKKIIITRKLKVKAKNVITKMKKKIVIKYAYILIIQI